MGLFLNYFNSSNFINKQTILLKFFNLNIFNIIKKQQCNFHIFRNKICYQEIIKIQDIILLLVR